ncbi:SDR family oxidoreductase [Solirubrobacter ginsenosidimutans]|uniref:SDR family oxidoreductase n=1 Tax=Solirubrobacter ginsenosidimutans TaxID=490573 RepID=A0A9X3S664_9ACTN|nr:SDR family oxidoreductase [Solirubrobacter ginsenosidimutans]MDA0162403.1 SDR family oxidoreductase [Solirubrobacter ginsenosidimutans]
MDVLVAGGHGQIARRLERLLVQHGHTARGLIRNPDHAKDLEADGALPVLCDLERDDVRPHVRGADALVFAAGAGPGSGDARKRTLDLGGAVKCIEAAQELGVDRFLMVSSMGTRDIPDDGPMKPYLEAKRDADLALTDSGLRWTIVRPGPLTNEPGSGMVELAPVLGRWGNIPRDDVALVLYQCLFAENTVHGTFELLSGAEPVESAVLSFTNR